jgi:hypothetical protein
MCITHTPKSNHTCTTSKICKIVFFETICFFLLLYFCLRKVDFKVTSAMYCINNISNTIMDIYHWHAAYAKAVAKEELLTFSPSDKIKLVQKNNNVSKLTKKEIVSLLLTWFGVKVNANKKRKGDMVDLLSREIEAHPARLL